MKKIASYLTNYIAASAGFSLGRLKDDPGDGTGSGATVQTGNDWLYAIYAPILKYLGDVSDADESESASDMVDTLERIAQTLGASAHIASYDYFSGNYILRDGIIWRANADIDTGVDGTDFISQYNAGKWDSQVLNTDREQIFGGSIKINTVDVLNDVDFGATDCFDLTSGDGINPLALTKEIDAVWAVGDAQGMLDTGSVAANTLYYLYAIKKDSDSVGDYLMSLSASSPTMPTGYTMKRIIGTLQTKEASAEIDYVTESVNRVNAQDISIGLLRIQNNEVLYNAEKVSGTYEYLSTGRAYRTDLSTGKKYEVASGTAGATISSWTVLSSGEISGSLIFNTTALPPKVSSGTRNVLGKEIQEIADVSLATTDAFGVCSQTFTDYLDCWMKVLVNDQGVYTYIPSFDSQPVASLTDISVSGVTVALSVATVATANTTGLSAGHMVIVKGSDVGYLLGKVTGVTAGVSFTMKTSAGDGSYSAGTYSAKFRIATLHGLGTITGVNTDADIGKYTPSPEFNPYYNGYCRDVDGDIDITATGVWVDIGPFYINASGQVTHVISYKSGESKNDNVFNADEYAGHGSTDTKIPYFANIRRAWGNEYTAINQSTNGCKITTNKSGYYSSSFFWSSDSITNSRGGITINTAQTTTNIQSVTDTNRVWYSYYPTTGTIGGDFDTKPIVVPTYMQEGDVLRPHTRGNTGVNAAAVKIIFTKVEV